MTQELDAAETALEVALKEYLTVCQQAFQHCNTELGTENHTVTRIPQTSNIFVNEYSRVLLLEKQIQRAKTAINHSRNGAAPLNTLPAEVLTRIFQLAAESKPCKLDPWGPDYEKLPSYSAAVQLMTHVCARWRQIILNNPLFWSYIDVTPLLHTHERIRDWTQASLVRSGHSSLDIHITSPYPVDEHWETAGLREFLGPLVPRMRSLDLEIQIDENQEEFDPEPSARDFCSSILSLCLGTSCSPGMLTQVNLEMETNYLFLEAAENPQQGDYMSLDVPAQHLEDIWRHVTILRLHNLFPPWTSAAYSGLVELSLSSGEWRGAFISEHYLASILSSSPQLRTLDLGLPIIPSNNPVTAVALPDLKTLILQPKNAENLEIALRLIIPSTKPLRLTIHTRGIQGDEFSQSTETAKFFARSNLTALHLIGVGGCFKLLGLVDKIDNIAFTISNNDDANTLVRNKPPCLHLGGLHILTDRIINFEIGELMQLVESYAPRMFLLWGACHINHMRKRFDNIAQIEEALSVPGTVAKFRRSEAPKSPEYNFIMF